MSCGALASTKLIIELQYWFNYAIINSSLNKNKIPVPPTLSTSYLPSKSFVEMLFNENYSQTEYYYKYNEYPSMATWPTPVKNRMIVYAASAQVHQCASDGTNNIFLLQSDDLTMLDALLLYRQDETGVTLIDTTGTTTITGNNIGVNYNSLQTSLSKLIYHYLNLKINNSYSSYDTETIISSSSELLASCFEAYLIEEIFQYISAQGT